MLNPTVLKPLWVKQTSKWLSLGEDHLKELVAKTTDVAVKIFLEATKDIDVTERTRHKLEQVITDFSIQERKKVLKQLYELCHKNATLALQTTNPQFEVNVIEARSKRFKGALERYRKANPPKHFLDRLLGEENRGFPVGPEVYERWAIVDDDYVTMLFNEIHPYGERAQNTQDEIHDLLKAYYDVSLIAFHPSFPNHYPAHLLLPLTQTHRLLSRTSSTMSILALSSLSSTARTAHSLAFRQTIFLA